MKSKRFWMVVLAAAVVGMASCSPPDDLQFADTSYEIVDIVEVKNAFPAGSKLQCHITSYKPWWSPVPLYKDDKPTCYLLYDSLATP